MNRTSEAMIDKAARSAKLALGRSGLVTAMVAVVLTSIGLGLAQAASKPPTDGQDWRQRQKSTSKWSPKWHCPWSKDSSRGWQQSKSGLEYKACVVTYREWAQTMVWVRNATSSDGRVWAEKLQFTATDSKTGKTESYYKGGISCNATKLAAGRNAVCFGKTIPRSGLSGRKLTATANVALGKLADGPETYETFPASHTITVK